MSTNSLNRDALVVSICLYDDLPMSEQLDNLGQQTEQLAQLLKTQGGFKVKHLPETVDFKLDLRKRVTLPELEQAIEKLLYPPEESPTQTALLFFAGHGLVKETRLGTEGFLATSESDGRSTFGVSLKWLRELLHNSPVKQQIVFLEACHSGTFFQSFEPDEKHDICFVTSARAHEEALAQGLLVQALLESLDCKKRLEDRITSEMLIRYLDKIQETNKGWQRFVYGIQGESILLSGVRGKLLHDTQSKQTLKSTAKSVFLPQKNQSVTIGDNATGNIIVVGDDNQIG
ncbi:MAG: hypothetical protein BWK79_19605 [Beggiatoa sp. IS2]|nr:MAG: hypothetical protein BWK79_19605 [Beggiatoa sp. IS2]